MTIIVIVLFVVLMIAIGVMKDNKTKTKTQTTPIKKSSPVQTARRTKPSADSKPKTFTPSVPQPDSLESIIANSYPSKNGLKVSEILMLSYAPKLKVNETKFQAFWAYQYNEKHPGQLLQGLANKGFITVASPSENLNNLKTAELKELLKSQGLPQTGKKADLIQRLIDNVDSYSLDFIAPNKYYTLTDLGKAELEANSYVPLYHSKHTLYGTDVWWMNKQLHSHPKSNYRDLLWGDLNKKAMKAMNEMQKGDFIPYVFNLKDRADFLINENRELNTALNLMTEHAFYAVNCNSVSEYAHKYEIYELNKDNNTMFINNPPNAEQCVIIDIYLFKKIKEKLSLDDESLFSDILSYLSTMPQNLSIIKNEDIAGLIVSLVNGDDESAQAVYHKLDKILKRTRS